MFRVFVTTIVVLLTLLALGGVATAQSPACALGVAVPTGASAGLIQDCETLLDIKDELRGSAALNWSPSLSITQWAGVRLGGTPQRVTIVKLQKRDLDGSIPAGIGRLDKLVDLWLYANELSGPLPAELGDLSNLETLMLANNSLSGQIPLELNNLSLERLWLKGNNFTGCVPHNLALAPDNDLSRVNLPTCSATGEPTPSPTPPPATATPGPAESLSDMVKRVRPAVVKIQVPLPDSLFLPFWSNGSGFIISTGEDGSAHLLTNDHVVDELEEVHVLVHDQDRYQAEIVARDPRRDIALLRICCGEFTTVEFMDSDVLHPGDEVIAIGYPQDNILPRKFRPGRDIVPREATVTRGIISAFRYYSFDDAQVVQHDAPINGGSSGGPLFSRDGRVVGINTFRFVDDPSREIVREGLHFAVLETTVQERLRLWDNGPSAQFGPLSGGLQHELDGFIERFDAEFTATEDEFALSAMFVNPYAASEHQWDYGFRWGNDADGGFIFYFVVDSSGAWRLIRRDASGSSDTSETLAGGTASQLLTDGNARNHLSLFVDGSYGFILINGQRIDDAEGESVPRIYLGDESPEGTVAVLTGYWQGSERSGYSTRYEDFTGHTYDHGE